MKEPKEKVLDYIKSNLEKHRSKWECGFSNDYWAWTDLLAAYEDRIINYKRKLSKEVEESMNGK